MATVFDFLKWRGDLSFSDVAVGEVDSLIFSMLSYIDYGSLCAGRELLLREAARGYCEDGKYDSVNMGLIVPSKEINRMFCTAAGSRRFGGVRISDYVAVTSIDDGCQFSAVTFHLPGKQLVVAFRGTDDSLVGWRENFSLSFLDEIPAQAYAVRYINDIAMKYPEERLILTGHSKGGNLAFYAAVRCNDEVKRRIRRAYCNDGPGLNRETVSSPDFKKMQKKLTVLMPESSYIGIMFEKGEKYHVIKCNGRGWLQHDPYYWEVEGHELIKLPELSQRGKKNEISFRQKMSAMSIEEKREFVETFFGLIESTGAKHLLDFTGGGIRKLLSFIKSYGGLEKQKREMMTTIAMYLLLDIKKQK